MRTFMFAVSLLAVSAIGMTNARAEIVEIPLPQLEGPYPATEQTRAMAIQIPGPPASVYGAAVRLRGTAIVGQYGGNDAVLCPTPTPWVMEFTVTLGEDPTHGWGAFVLTPEETGEFEGTEDFLYALGVTDFSFLLDGAATVFLAGWPTGMPLGCSPATEFPEATVSEATLILDGDFPVQTHGSTWGRLKALFR